jgi:1,4-dihydroxy-2-naphthoyl-CoA hydrolase
VCGNLSSRALFTPEDINARLEGFFPGELGIEVVEVSTEGARGRLKVAKRHLHPGGFVHGGVWASLADTVAAWASIANLREGTNFSTAEMKTNLFGVAREGDVLDAVAVPLHVGRRTQVWEVRVEVGQKLCALFVCTQVIVEID